MRYELVICDSETPTYEVSGINKYYVIENGEYVEREGTEISVPMYDFSLDNAYEMLHKVKMSFSNIEKVRLFVYSTDEINKLGMLFWTI